MIPALTNSDTTKKIALGLGIVVVGGVAYYFINKKIREAKELQVSKSIGANTTDGIALRYATAIKSSFSIWGWTNLTAFFNAIKGILRDNIPFSKVIEAYNKLYGENLIKEIQSELSANEYAQFTKLIYGR